jgi:hypothetical protein
MGLAADPQNRSQIDGKIEKPQPFGAALRGKFIFLY